jgi:hypothetical protein
MVNVYGNILNMEAKTERNSRIKEYHVKHPNTSIRAIGRMFKISHVRVLKILARQDEPPQNAQPAPSSPAPDQFHIGKSEAA